MSIMEFDAPREHLEWGSSEGYIPINEWKSNDHKFVAKTKDYRKVLRMVSHWDIWSPGGLLLENVSLELLLGPHGYEICKAALSTYGGAIEYIPETVWESFTSIQADVLCQMATKESANTVKLFSEAAWKAMSPLGSYTVCEKAIASFTDNLKHIAGQAWESFTSEQIDDLCLLATKKDISAIKLFSEAAWKAMSPEGRYAICKNAIAVRSSNLSYLHGAAHLMTDQQYYDLCKEAIMKSSVCDNLSFAPGMSDEFYKSLDAIFKSRW